LERGFELVQARMRDDRDPSEAADEPADLGRARARVVDVSRLPRAEEAIEGLALVLHVALRDEGPRDVRASDRAPRVRRGAGHVLAAERRSELGEALEHVVEPFLAGAVTLRLPLEEPRDALGREVAEHVEVLLAGEAAVRPRKER